MNRYFKIYNIFHIIVSYLKTGTKALKVHHKVTQRNRALYPDIAGPVHVAQWGTCITTPVVNSSSATISVRTSIENHYLAPVSVSFNYSFNTNIL